MKIIHQICVGIALSWLVSAHAQEPYLTISREALPMLETLATQAGSTIVIEQSRDLIEWRFFAQVRDRLAPYAVRSVASSFFRMQTRDREPSDDWSNQFDLRSDHLVADHPSGVSFTKFTMPLTNDAASVFFQDTNAYPFHYQFIVARLAGYDQLTLSEFESVALRRENQELLLGSVLMPSDTNIHEVAIQFAGSDPYTPDDVTRWFRQIQARLAPLDGSWRFFYMPSFEQREVAFENESFFAERGIAVESPTRWNRDHRCYSEGWAFGRLVFVPGNEIDAAYGDGRLTNADILLTDGVPAEIPVVAGVISLTPTTPNSHVAILAQSFRLPFAFASGAGFQDQLRTLADREILLVVGHEQDGSCSINGTDTTGQLTPNERQAILDLKKAPAPAIRPRRVTGSTTLEVTDLTPIQVDQVGGKAANFGFLRRALPEHSPSPVVALTFDLWDAFFTQSFGNVTLKLQIEERLRDITYPPDVTALRPALNEIRRWIREEARFSDLQKQEITDGLNIFAPNQKIRFRSSTNMEDSEAFSGAGLYDSYSGCLADDLDDDDVGPSHCASSKDHERGVFRAIQKVYASFYNENAYIERLRHGISESDVGMAILVHHSFPDVNELANGVATMEISMDRQSTTNLVTQLGAHSVANPDGSQQPEMVRASETLTLLQPSSLIEGEQKHVMNWPDDYEQLVDLLGQAAFAYEEFHGASERLVLDFEYKKMKDVGLVVKQIRAIPQLPIIPPPTL